MSTSTSWETYIERRCDEAESKLADATTELAALRSEHAQMEAMLERYGHLLNFGPRDWRAARSECLSIDADFRAMKVKRT